MKNVCILCGNDYTPKYPGAFHEPTEEQLEDIGCLFETFYYSCPDCLKHFKYALRTDPVITSITNAAVRHRYIENLQKKI